MLLSIISPLDKKSYKILWLELNTPLGNFVIQPEHAPTILTLAPNRPVIFCLHNGKEESINITQGIVEISRSTATIFISDSSV